jgi:D-alanyl-D-alanine carboxypeptidase
MTFPQEQAIFAENVGKLIAHIFSTGYKCSLGEAFRTQEQAAIYAKEGKGILHSLHCERLAIDINLFKPDGTFVVDAQDYQQFGDYWEKLHEKNRWGGHFTSGLKDTDHFEYRV